MENIFCRIEQQLFMLYYGVLLWVVFAGLLIICCKRCFRNDNFVEVWFCLSVITALAAGITTVATISCIGSESGDLRGIVESESVSNQLVVAEKKSNVEFDYYRLECGRIKEIYARVPKFYELSRTRHYKIKLNDHECIVPGDYIENCIDQAITRYELYREK